MIPNYNSNVPRYTSRELHAGNLPNEIREILFWPLRGELIESDCEHAIIRYSARGKTFEIESLTPDHQILNDSDINFDFCFIDKNSYDQIRSMINESINNIFGRFSVIATPFEIKGHKASANFDGAIFSDGLSIGAKFSDKVSFNYVTFRRSVLFFDGRYSGEVSFRDAEFLDEVSFVRVTFSGKTSFYNAKFSKVIDTELDSANLVGLCADDKAEYEANYEITASFNRVIFSSEVEFTCVKFSGKASFFGAEFFDYVSFCGAEFFDEISFKRAKFNGESSFDTAKFHREVSFDTAKFSRTTSFIEVKFSRAASFEVVKFSDKVIFSGSKFSKKVSFLSSEFSGETSFNGGTLSDATFDYSKMEKSLSFKNIKANKLTLYGSRIRDLTISSEQKEEMSISLREVVITESAIVDISHLKALDLYKTIIGHHFKIKWNDNVKDALKCKLNKNEGYAEVENIHDYVSEELLLLKENYRIQGLYEDEDAAYVEFKRVQRKTLRPLRKTVSRVADIIGVYGTKPLRVVLFMLATILFFGILYFILWPEFTTTDAGVGFWDKVVNSFYTSGIIFVTIGFTKMVPSTGWSMLLIMIEGFLGLFMIAYFTISFSRKIR